MKNLKKSQKSKKHGKSVLAKSFRLPKVSFWRERIFEFFHRRRFFPEKPSFLTNPSFLVDLSTSKSEFQNSLTPDPWHPHAPKFNGSPGRSFPGSRAIFGAIAALQREKSTKNRFFIASPRQAPPLAKTATMVPKTTKIEITRKPLE